MNQIIQSALLSIRVTIIYEPERTFVRVLCTDATESMADLANQLSPTLNRCSSVGNLIKYAIFLAEVMMENWLKT